MSENVQDAQVDQLEAACEVAAAQFAGGMEIAVIAEEWDRDENWVVSAIRRALLKFIPAREGGLKRSRTERQSAKRAEETRIGELQPTLPLPAALPGRMLPAKKVLGYAENGYRVGESHHNTRISDEVVDSIREMHEEGRKTIPEIAEELELPFGTVAKICAYQRRATPAVRFKRVQQ